MYACTECPATFRKSASLVRHSEAHAEQTTFLKKYEKTNLDGIERVNGVPRVVYVCWFGGFGGGDSSDSVHVPFMSPNRFAAFQSLCANIDAPVILITGRTYTHWNVPESPVHPLFDRLSGVHKSDYFRCYMLHHYGGGYHDVKHRDTGWSGAWGDGRQTPTHGCSAAEN